MDQIVTVADVMEAMELKDFTPGLSKDKPITVPEIQRPGLQLTGFFNHFVTERIQVMGNAEIAYMDSLSEEERINSFTKFVEYGDIPCLILAGGNTAEKNLLKIAESNNIPVLATDETTSQFVVKLMQWLAAKLAPMQAVHAVLMDVFGEGVLIMGESGIGKSEAALELIKRGHRLVSDDIVEIKEIEKGRLVGRSPEITKHLLEVRGIGIMDVKTLFGIECVEDTHRIDQVVKFVEWNKNAEYDRVGTKDEFIKFHNTEIPCYTIPIRPGRNLAVIVETAAVNSRQKRMGYNAADELYRRVAENLAKNRK